jgi:amino acid permease
MTLFTGIVPLYGSSLLYVGPAGLVWGWVVVSFFTWFVGFAMAEICSSFPVSDLSTLCRPCYLMLEDRREVLMVLCHL